jgi:hypothetical protein
VTLSQPYRPRACCINTHLGQSHMSQRQLEERLL